MAKFTYRAVEFKQPVQDGIKERNPSTPGAKQSGLISFASHPSIIQKAPAAPAARAFHIEFLGRYSVAPPRFIRSSK